MKIPYPLVQVLWEDTSHLDMGWRNDTPPYKPMLVSSFGLLIHEDRKRLVLAMDYEDGDGEHNQRAQIPRGMVRSIRVLRKKDRQ